MKKANADPHLSNAFAEIAREYCRLIEAHGKMSRRKFLEGVLNTLSRLYAAGVQLPDCANSEAEFVEARLTHQQWQKLFISLQKKVGPYSSYRMFFNPWVEDMLVGGDLADDLADIYRDARAYLPIHAQGTTDAINEAVWHWRFSLNSHWGRHATSALFAIQVLKADGHLTGL